MRVSAEIRFIRSAARHSLSDSERDEEIIRGPQIPQIAQFVEQHRPDWKEHVEDSRTDRRPKGKEVSEKL
jgi:hypothetical protein